MVMLEVQQLRKAFGSLQAVQDVSFALREGRTAALLGPNGAGKSTMLRMLAGLLHPDAGQIRLAGMPAGSDRRAAIGYLPQYPAFYAWMTGREYLQFAGRLSGLKRREAVRRAAELLESVGLQEAANRRIGGYSGGMRQRLGLAQAVMHRPRLLILDEPVSALDPIGRREVLDLLQAWKTEMTILYATHVLHDAEELTDDLLILHEGKVLLTGQLREVMDKHRQPVIRLRSERSLDGHGNELAALNGVKEVKQEGDWAELTVEERDAGMARVVRYIAEQDIPVRKLEAAELTLEDLFMKAVNGR